MSAPLVSIIVPSFNAARYLPTLCESIRRQSCDDFEVLIGNDASTDATEEVARSFLDDPRFQYFSWEKNMGVHQATAFLMRKAKGTYWCNPGADDVLADDFVAQRVGMLKEHPSAVLAFGPTDFIDEDGLPVVPDSVALDIPPVIPGKEALTMLLQHNIVGTSSVMLRAEHVRPALPLWGEGCRYAQDWLLWLLLAGTDHEFIRDETVLVSYRIHPDSLTTLPELAGIRRAETRIVPLLGLANAAKLEAPSAELWDKWRRPLYCLWLRRAARLRGNNLLKAEWLTAAAEAYYGAKRESLSLAIELVRFLPWIVLYSIRDARRCREQKLPVAGLSLVNHPLFRKASS